MSYDVHIVVPSGPDATTCVFSADYTSNVSQMWNHALGDPPERMVTKPDWQGNEREVHEWGLGLFDGAPCSEAAGPLAAAVRRMEANPSEYVQWEPDNGWGDYAGALGFLRDIAEAAAKHSYGVIRVSR